MNPYRPDDKVVLITGAARGQGARCDRMTKRIIEDVCRA